MTDARFEAGSGRFAGNNVEASGAGNGGIEEVGDPPDPGRDGRVELVWVSPPGLRCGDGTVHAGEGCDDGNASGNDGCSDRCEVESYGSGGDSCATALPLTLVPTSNDIWAAMAQGQVAGASNAHTSTCSSTGPDRVYSVSIPVAGRLSASVAGGGSTLVGLALTGPGTLACNGISGEVACLSPGAAGEGRVLEADVVMDVYSLWVETNASGNNYVLTLLLLPSS